VAPVAFPHRPCCYYWLQKIKSVQCWEMLQWNNCHTKLCESRRTDSKGETGLPTDSFTDVDTERHVQQRTELRSLLFYFVSEKSKLNYVGTSPLTCLKSLKCFCLSLTERKELIEEYICTADSFGFVVVRLFAVLN